MSGKLFAYRGHADTPGAGGRVLVKWRRRASALSSIGRVARCLGGFCVEGGFLEAGMVVSFLLRCRGFRGGVCFIVFIVCYCWN